MHLCNCVAQSQKFSGTSTYQVIFTLVFSLEWLGNSMFYLNLLILLSEP